MRCARISRWRGCGIYTGTPVEHFQPFVLFTNYTRYVDEFVRWACAQIADPASPYIAPLQRRRHPHHAGNPCPRAGSVRIWRGKTTRCRPIT